MALELNARSLPSKIRSIGLLISLASLVCCGTDGDPLRDRAETRPDPFASIEERSRASPPQRKSAPRWEEVTVWTGAGPATRSLAISKDAIQWRAEWSCESGELKLETDPAPRNARPIAESECPGSGSAYSVRSGTVRLSVENQGAWRIAVSQQVTTPVDEAPLPEMTAPGARLLSKGAFFAVERKGKGEALLFRLPGGDLAVRLQGFETSANTDLFVWASEAVRPATSKEALDSPHVVLSELRSTVGNQNYRVPPELDEARIRSIVIWCQPVQIAYVAAALQPSQG